jgi:hypothetical protein
MKQQFTITVRQFRREEINETRPDGGTNRGHRSVELEPTREVVEVEVDLEGIAKELGTKACRNSGGTAREISGLVKVKHLRGAK